jgi:hypothetical protein
VWVERWVLNLMEKQGIKVSRTGGSAANWGLLYEKGNDWGLETLHN